MKINICMAFDDNYAKYGAVTIASVLKNADKDDELCFYILDGGINQCNKEKINDLKKIKNFEITYLIINENLFSDYKEIKTHKYISIVTYYRLKLGQLLNIDKVIYLDCDMVVNSSLSPLYSINMNNIPIAGVKDLDFNTSNFSTYINAGMMVINLDYIRKNNIENDYLKYTQNNKNNITCGDQEIINAVLNGQIKLLSDTWNVQVANFFTRSSKNKNPKIIHYIGSSKPWMNFSWAWHKEFYYKYLKLTPWYINDKYKYKTLMIENLIGNIALITYRIMCFWKIQKRKNKS